MADTFNAELLWLIYRIVLSLALLIFLISASINSWRNSKLLEQEQDDRRAREAAVIDLRNTADELGRRTEEALQIREHAAHQQMAEINDKLDKSALLNKDVKDLGKQNLEETTGVGKKVDDVLEQTKEKL